MMTNNVISVLISFFELKKIEYYKNQQMSKDNSASVKLIKQIEWELPIDLELIEKSYQFHINSLGVFINIIVELPNNIFKQTIKKYKLEEKYESIIYACLHIDNADNMISIMESNQYDDKFICKICNVAATFNYKKCFAYLQARYNPKLSNSIQAHLEPNNVCPDSTMVQYCMQNNFERIKQQLQAGYDVKLINSAFFVKVHQNCDFIANIMQDDVTKQIDMTCAVIYCWFMQLHDIKDLILRYASVIDPIIIPHVISYRLNIPGIKFHDDNKIYIIATAKFKQFEPYLNAVLLCISGK